MKPIEVIQAADEIRASSSHSGYNRLGVEHRRVLRMLSSGVVIEDALIGAGEHAFEVFWHLAAGWRVKQEAGCEFHICGPLSLKLKVESGIPLSCSHELVDISRSYGGATQKGVRLKAAGNGDFPCTVTTSISW
jgi:hypothetical protein